MRLYGTNLQTRRFRLLGLPALRSDPRILTACALYGLAMFAGDGVILSTVGLLLAQRFAAGITLGGLTLGLASATGVLLAFRSLVASAGGPLAGHLSDARSRGRWPVVAASLALGTAGFAVDHQSNVVRRLEESMHRLPVLMLACILFVLGACTVHLPQPPLSTPVPPSAAPTAPHPQTPAVTATHLPVTGMASSTRPFDTPAATLVNTAATDCRECVSATPNAVPSPTATPAYTPIATPVPAANPTAALPQSVASQIDALFARWNNSQSPGCAVGLGQSGTPVYMRGYGMADLERGIPIGAGTIFNAGSISKQVTGLSIALLVADGRLSLDDDIRQYMPELPDYGSPVTIRRLLSHTSGVRDDRTLALMAGWRDDDPLTEQDLLGLILRQRGMNFKPGQEFLYSNSNYTLLAQVAARASGQSLPQLTKARIFEPLGMTSTFFAVGQSPDVPGIAYGYAPHSGRFAPAMPNVVIPGPSSLHTTVGDLIAWAGNLSAGAVGGMSTVQQMLEPATLTNRAPVRYNFGLNLQTFAGLGRVAWHDGHDGGYRSYLLILLERDVAVAVLCNLETIDPAPLALEAARIYLSPGATPRPSPIPSATPTVPAEPPIRLPAAELAARAGAYFDRNTTHLVHLYVEGARLKIEGRSTLSLAPLSANRYCVYRGEVMTSGEVQFTPAGEGKFRAEIRNVDWLAGKYEAYPDLGGQEGMYAGDYYSAELDATYSIAIEGGILTLHSRRFVSVPLLPVGAHEYVMAEALPRIPVQFTLGAAGDATGFTLSLDRARGVQFGR